jgi:hypothetical protein
VTSVKNIIKCLKLWQAAQRQNQENESEITMCDRMKMYNSNTLCLSISHLIYGSIQSYETARESHRSTMAVKQSLDHASVRHLGTHLAGSFHIFKIFWVIQFTLSRDIATISAIFLADILRTCNEWHACFLELSLELVSQNGLRLECSNVLFWTQQLSSWLRVGKALII